MADGVWTGRLTHLLGRLPGAKAAARAHARLYRRTNGRFGGRWFRAPVLVLETVGRATGAIRATPLIYMTWDGAPVVVAANGGSARTPNWWLNLRAAGQATVYIKGRRRRVRPRELTGAQREAVLERFQRSHPSLRRYQQYTLRPFPVIVLDASDDPVQLVPEAAAPPDHGGDGQQHQTGQQPQRRVALDRAVEAQ